MGSPLVPKLVSLPSVLRLNVQDPLATQATFCTATALARVLSVTNVVVVTVPWRALGATGVLPPPPPQALRAIAMKTVSAAPKNRGVEGCQPIIMRFPVLNCEKPSGLFLSRLYLRYYGMACTSRWRAFGASHKDSARPRCGSASVRVLHI